MAKGDYYSILGISKTADATVIRNAYKKLALQNHPDKNRHRIEEATAKFKVIAEAYSTLQDPVKRKQYDADIGVGSGGKRRESYSTWEKKQHDPENERQGWDAEDRKRKEEYDRKAHEFEMRRARQMFRETFGDEFTDGLSQAVTNISDKYSVAADKCGKSYIVSGPVDAHLSSIVNDIDACVENRQRFAEASRQAMDDATTRSREFDRRHAAVRAARRSRRSSFLEDVRETILRERATADREEDIKAFDKSVELEFRAEQARVAWRQACLELAYLERRADELRRNRGTVARRGASFGHAAKAVVYYSCRMAAKVAYMLPGCRACHAQWNRAARA